MTPLYATFQSVEPNRYRYIGGMDGRDLWLSPAPATDPLAPRLHIVEGTGDADWAVYFVFKGKLEGVGEDDENTATTRRLRQWAADNKAQIEQYLRLFAPELVEH